MAVTQRWKASSRNSWVTKALKVIFDFFSHSLIAKSSAFSAATGLLGTLIASSGGIGNKGTMGGTGGGKAPHESPHPICLITLSSRH